MSVAMAKKGRPRQSGARYPSGKLVPEDATLVAKYRRIRENASHLGDPALGSPLGAVWYWRKITDAEYEAGKKYAALRRAYLEAMSLPQETVRAQVLMDTRAYEPGDTPEREEERQAIRRRFERVHAALQASGKLSVAMVLEVACHDQPIGNAARMEWLRNGLRHLVAHFRLAP